MDMFAVLGECQRVKPRIEEAEGEDADFAVILAVVNFKVSSVEVEILGACEGDSVLPFVGSVFLRVVRDLHNLTVYAI